MKLGSGSRGRQVSFVENLESRCLLSATPAADLSFGNQGLATTGVINNSSGNYAAVALQSDGKIIAASTGSIGGTGTNAIIIQRLNTDGSLDTTFGTAGDAAFPDDSIFIEKVFIQTDGKIIVSATNSPFTSASELVRFNADGSVDTTFGTGGTLSVGMLAKGIAEAPQGGLLIAGSTNSVTLHTPLLVAHVNADGSMDSSYGDGGTVTLDGAGRGAYNLGPAMLLATPDGKVVVVGSELDMRQQGRTGDGWVMARLNSDGSIDSAFNNGQPVQYAAPNAFGDVYVNDAKLLPDGSILVATHDAATVTLVRYNFDGSLDASFGTNSIATDTITNDPLNNYMAAPMKLVVRPTGEIVAEGFGTSFIYNGHFTPTGQLLQSEISNVYVFNGGGATSTVTADSPGGVVFNEGDGAAVDPNGNLIGFGETSQRADSSSPWVYPVIGVRVNLDDYVWAGDPSFQWAAYGQPETASTSGDSSQSSVGVTLPKLTTTAISAKQQLAAANLELTTEQKTLKQMRRQHARGIAALQKQINHDRAAVTFLRHAVTKLLATQKRLQKKASK